MPSITEAIRQSPQIAALLRQNQNHDALLAIIAAALPASMQHHRCRLKISENHLTLIAPNHALAAKLRQRRPTIAACLRQQGWQFDNIHIMASKNQAIPTTAMPLYIIKPALSPATCNRLRELARRLRHLPRATEALMRIADTHSATDSQAVSENTPT